MRERNVREREKDWKISTDRKERSNTFKMFGLSFFQIFKRVETNFGKRISSFICPTTVFMVITRLTGRL